VVKYHQKVLITELIVDLLKQKVDEISERFEVEILGIELNMDHVHLLFKSKPTLDLPKYINALKIITSREIRRIFPEVKDKLWSLLIFTWIRIMANPTTLISW